MSNKYLKSGCRQCNNSVNMRFWIQKWEAELFFQKETNTSLFGIKCPPPHSVNRNMLRQFCCYEWRWKLKAEKYCCVFIATSWLSSVLFHLSDGSIRSKPSKERQELREGTEKLNSFTLAAASYSLPATPTMFFPTTEKSWSVMEIRSSVGIPVGFSAFSIASYELPLF